MSVERAKELSEICRLSIYFLSALGMGVCLLKGRTRKGRGPEKLLLLGLLAMATGTFLSIYGTQLGLSESWGRIVGDLVLVNAGTAVTVAAIYLLTVKFHLVTLALRKEANTDHLTGLHNRRSFFRELDRRLGEGESFAVAVLDLDNMKQVNDSLGHQVGDAVLKAAGKAIARSVREKDIAARYGGDEFAILFYGSGPRAEKFRARLEEHLLEELPYTDGIEVGISFGLARCPEDGSDARTLLSVADARMYSDKGARKRRGYPHAVLSSQGWHTEMPGITGNRRFVVVDGGRGPEGG
ncbi:MAG: GGDEF domain-containing protein [Moorellaceae bacterium]